MRKLKTKEEIAQAIKDYNTLPFSVWYEKYKIKGGVIVAADKLEKLGEKFGVTEKLDKGDNNEKEKR